MKHTKYKTFLILSETHQDLSKSFTRKKRLVSVKLSPWQVSPNCAQLGCQGLCHSGLTVPGSAGIGLVSARSSTGLALFTHAGLTDLHLDQDLARVMWTQPPPATSQWPTTAKVLILRSIKCLDRWYFPHVIGFEWEDARKIKYITGRLFLNQLK